MKKMKVFSYGMLILLSVSWAAAQDSLASRKLIQALIEEVSGEIAFNYTVLISHFDRIQASEGLRDSALMIKEELEKIGYTDAEIEGWPSNGSTYYYTYRTPIPWIARSAELWMKTPRRERLCSFKEMPLTLVKHSHSADVEAELVDVGVGTGDDSYAGKDVEGKIVLATAYTGDVVREAVLKRGALGVVTWYPPEVRPGYPNMVRYTAIWPTWEERERVGFGFNVSKNQGWLLKRMLDAGQKVVLEATVDAEFQDGRIEVLSASIPGREEPEKEVMIIGHLCHPAPSANDNASGSGGMLEMARALKSLIDKGRIEPPRRTIRFLWVPEFYGTVPYIKAHLERTRNTLAVINCDMIGEDLHLTGGTFNITCTPDSLPSFLNDVVVDFTRLADRLNLRSINGSLHPFAYRVRPFSGGSDHYVFNDGALRVPSVMFGHGDTFHHTSLDTPDKVDSSELRRVCFVALGATYYMANASDPEAVDMARLIARNGIGRLSGDYYDILQSLIHSEGAEDIHGARDRTLNVIGHSFQRERDAVMSAAVFLTDRSRLAEVERLTKNLDLLAGAFAQEARAVYSGKCEGLGIPQEKMALTPAEERMKGVIPVRDPGFVCPLQNEYLVDRLGEDAVGSLSLRGNAAYEALNFVDGKRSVLNIARAVSAEFSPVSVEKVHGFFRMLEKAGLIKFK